MADIIIVAFIVGIMGMAVWGTVKHFRGESSCCGGASFKPEQKKLKGKIVQTYTLEIEGMHCQNCANKVMSAINDIDGASAKVKLKKNVAIICCDREVAVEEIIQKIESKGYSVTNRASL